MSAKLTWVPLLFITLVQALWAAPLMGAAHRRYAEQSAGRERSISRKAVRASNPSQLARDLPLPVDFRTVRDRGLLADAWINGSGPYTFAIDTGAGSTIISARLAGALDISARSGQRISLSGLSGRGQTGGHPGFIKTLALGHAENLLPANRNVIVSPGLPSDIDGILDPTEAYFPFGYTIDLPNRQISAFDCAISPVNTRNPPREGAVVPWLTNGGSRRPFVRLDDGRQALLDTGSSLGLALTEGSAPYDRRYDRRVQDIGGGSVSSRRVEPSTVSIGALTLRRVPTDVLSGVQKGTPVLLGREALSPFRLSFDPVHRLIAIDPAER